jgi:hypothetical protein
MRSAVRPTDVRPSFVFNDTIVFCGLRITAEYFHKRRGEGVTANFLAVALSFFLKGLAGFQRT